MGNKSCKTGKAIEQQIQELKDRGHTCISDSSQTSGKMAWKKFTRNGHCCVSSEYIHFWCGKEPCNGVLSGMCNVIE